jgi:integrase
MLLAMLLGGLRRCEVLGLRLVDIALANRKVTITEGKGGALGLGCAGCARLVSAAGRHVQSLGTAWWSDEPPPAPGISDGWNQLLRALKDAGAGSESG